MLSLVIHAGYEVGDICIKNNVCSVKKNSCNDRYFHNQHEASKKKLCLYFQFHKLFVKSKKNGLNYC